MLKASVTCPSSCQLRDVCHAVPARAPGLQTFAGGIQEYCRGTRWLVGASLLLPVAAAAGLGLSRFLA